ncbi:MAG: hypothetical protein LBE72_06215 [Rickettsia sp.]|jgi:tetratricopeptide (TPR) repeat protein|nr:hypothetical protein [Rickettsia sp.]
MKEHYESKYNPAVKEISDYIHKNARDSGIHPEMLAKITSVLEGVKRTDEMISQKEQLLVQKEKELKAFRASVDNSSKVARDVVNESKQHLDKAESLYKLKNFSEALEYSNKALYSIGNINGLEVKTVAQANKLYVERLELYKESEAKKDYLYNSAVVSSGNKSVNAFGWVKENPTRCFYSFFKDVLKVPDNTADNIKIIKKLYDLLPSYIGEAQRTNHFYNEYNKYYNAMTKLQQVVNIHNIRAASSKGLKDYEGALKSCEIALEIDPKSSTLSKLKNSILQEKQGIEAIKLKEKELSVGKDKLISDKDQEIEALKALLALQKAETQKKDALLLAKELEKKELLDRKEKEILDLKTLNLVRELESQENKELLNLVINELQEKIVLKDNENAHLKDVNKQLSHIEVGIQMSGNEVSIQTDEINLAGNHMEA